MFIVQIEYEIKGEGFTESCEVFDEILEARQFARDAIDEICEKIQEGDEVVDADVHIWYTGDGNR